MAASAGVFGAGVAIFDTLIYGGPLRSGYRPGEITFSLSALGANLWYMPAHLIQAMPVLVLGLGALAGIAVTWLRGRRAGGQRAAAAGRDLAVALALAACWAAIWVLYATYSWTAAPGLSTLQAARFYVPALGAISLLGAWPLVRVPRRQPLVAITTLAVVAALPGLGGWAFHDMYQSCSGHSSSWCPGRAARSNWSQAQQLRPAARPPARAAPPTRLRLIIAPHKSADANRARMPVRDVNEAVVLTIRFTTITAGVRASSSIASITRRGHRRCLPVAVGSRARGVGSLDVRDGHLQAPRPSAGT